MTQPLTPLQPRQKEQNVKKCAILQMKMENVIPCVKCDKKFYNAKDLTNHLGVHAAMDRKVDLQKSFESLKNSKMQVLINNMKLPIKREREGSSENNPKRIKIQDGAKELSVNCLVDKLSCTICKPKRNFKEPSAYRYHMMVTHSDLDNFTLPSSPPRISQPVGSGGTPSECITPNKFKVRVKSQASTVEIVDMTEESPNKSVIDQSVMKKLKNLTSTSVSLSDLQSSFKSDHLDSEELIVNNSKLGKFSSLQQVRMSTKKRGLGSKKRVENLTNIVKSESPNKSVKLKFKEYVTADSESDFEILEREVSDKNKAPLKGDIIYEKVSAVIDSVLKQTNSKRPFTTSDIVQSSLKQYPTRTFEEPKDSGAHIKLFVNGLKNPVKSLSPVKTQPSKQFSTLIKSPKAQVVVPNCVRNPAAEQVKDLQITSCPTGSDESEAKVSPRTKSGRRVVKSKRLISTESAEIPSLETSKADEIVISADAKYSDNVHKELSTSSEVVPDDLAQASSPNSSKPKAQIDSDNYNPETQTSDSATANSDAEFAQPLRKSSRVRGPKPPQIRDPIENPAPKTKRRLSERKFEGAKPFKCNHCPLSYSNIESKKIHETTHEEKSYQCVYCDMRFTIEFSLKKHTRIHRT
eukprot:GFUD01026353.1.p1 GENE.GFUD01026353.1~~GFUD01026353.1.p1  ORF type:complete len:635 (-),score=141.13 GFUD01026353.1:239-2143(-)